MTIKEIAQMAGVSISTVSKIMNGKDDSIGKETKEKVLRVVKEYNYTPYANVLSGNGSRRFLIGAILGNSREDNRLFMAINQYAASHGYSVLCCRHNDSTKDELQAVMRLCHQNVEGVIWKRVAEESKQWKHYFDEKDITVLHCDEMEPESLNLLDYGRLGYDGARYLIEKQHRMIGCISQGDNRSSRFIKGVQRCLYNNQMKLESDLLYGGDTDFSFRDFKVYGVTAIVCQSVEIGIELLKRAKIEFVKIPEEISVVAIGDEKDIELMVPSLTLVQAPVEHMGQSLCQQLLGRIEGHSGEAMAKPPTHRVIEGETAMMLPSHKRKKIVVVGSINMDSVINVDELAEAGQTIIAENINNLPGGKGSNQAVGAAKLGANVHLIGKVGQDYEAKILRDSMSRYGVELNCVSETPLAGTGKAYITVQKNGESSIIVYPGANQLLKKEDILEYSEAFEDAGYCLLQLESPWKTVEYAAELAVKKGVKVILKPAAAKEVTDYLLKKVDIFVPNHKELNMLIPGDLPLEDKAQAFLDRGVNHVIVTLGHHGCYLKNHIQSLYFSPADFKALDTTGAADAFISALAVYLMEGISLNLAIKHAVYAAGISITRPGVHSSLVDRMTMKLYAEEIDRNIKTSKYKMF